MSTMSLSSNELSDGVGEWKNRFRQEVETNQNLSNEEEENIWDNEETPPTYDSLFGQFKDAKEKSDGPFDLVKRATQLFAGTIGCTVALSFLLALPIAMIVIGIQYRKECPVEPFIPVYLIVAGSCGLLKAIIMSCEKLSDKGLEKDLSSDDDISNTTRFLDGLLNIFMFTWFIAGNIWVYSHYRPNSRPTLFDPYNYCHPTLYWFAFWVITVSYVIMGIICFCICCLGACASCTAFFVTKT